MKIEQHSRFANITAALIKTEGPLLMKRIVHFFNIFCMRIQVLLKWNNVYCLHFEEWQGMWRQLLYSLECELLKVAGEKVVKQFEIFFEQIWQTDIIPDEFRDAIIHQLHREGEKTNVNTYSGISLRYHATSHEKDSF